MPKIKRLKSRLMFHANRWDVREYSYMQNNTPKTFDYITEPSDSVVTIALTAKQEVVLIREYRLPIQHYNLELPGGSIDSDQPLAAAKRELLEETGIIATKWHKLGKLRPFPAVSLETKHVYMAQDIDIQKVKPQQAEDISRIFFVPIKEISKMIALGKITDSQTIAGLTLAQIRLGLTK